MYTNSALSLAIWLPILVRHVQYGYIYYYAFAMMISLFLLMALFLHR